MSNEIRKQALPTIQELATDNIEQAFKDDALNAILYKQIPGQWIKTHPFIKDYKYVSVDKLKQLATQLFQRIEIEVVGYSQLFNSVACHVRVKVRNPLNHDEWITQDGVGACPVQTDKGSSAADMGAIKSSAIQMALPAAKSYAVKDALEELGTLFGAGLNNKELEAFKPIYNTEVIREQFNTKTNDKAAQ